MGDSSSDDVDDEADDDDDEADAHLNIVTVNQLCRNNDQYHHYIHQVIPVKVSILYRRFDHD